MFTRSTVLPLLWLLAAMLLCPAVVAAEVSVDDARIRLPLPGQSAAVVYLSLHNRGESDLALIAVEVEGFSRAEMHEHQHIDGLMKMRAVERIALAAGESVHFRPHHYHIMAFGMLESVARQTNQRYGVRLIFAGGDAVDTMAGTIR